MLHSLLSDYLWHAGRTAEHDFTGQGLHYYRPLRNINISAIKAKPTLLEWHILEFLKSFFHDSYGYSADFPAWRVRKGIFKVVCHEKTTVQCRIQLTTPGRLDIS
jgi:hypothetical protein